MNIDVDQLARVLAVNAEALAIQARVAGMTADNVAACLRKEPPPYKGEHFDNEAAGLFHCSASLRLLGGA